MLEKAKHLIRAIQSIPGSFHYQIDVHERQLMLMGRQCAWMLQQNPELADLAGAEFRVFSQWGEDGIIEWLIQNLPIKETTFVEFGVENYMEANTRFLIQNRNWRGLILDGNAAHMDYVRSTPLYWKHDLTAACAFVTRENINEVLKDNGFSGKIGLLSVDIDGNDYWVAGAIDVIDPAILIMEYNPVFGDMVPVTVPYDAGFSRFNAHYSGMYFGASIGAVRELAERKGYRFVGTCSNGINAFFVREELFAHIEPKLKSLKAYPSRHRDSRDQHGNLSYAAGEDRLALIDDMPVVCVADGEQRLLRDLGPLYSESWLADM